MFYTGQKVIVIGKAPQACGDDLGASMPKVGDIVTVRKTFNSPLGPQGELGFLQKWFRPLCEPKTSIEIFRKALTDDLIGEEA